VDVEDRPLREKVLGMVKMLGNPRMMLLLPMMFFTGLNNTFYAAWFTRQILSCHTGLVLLALGAGEMVGAYCTGACLCLPCFACVSFGSLQPLTF
jgi:hypothetical protein